MTSMELDTHMIRNPSGTGRQDSTCTKNSAYASRLRNLMEEIGDTIIIMELIMVAEQLITMVAWER
jgi:hypothetical protein